MTLSGQAAKKRIKAVHRRLVKAFGERRPDEMSDPLDQLIATILSQNTSDVNSLRAFERLKGEFSDWEKAAKANESRIERVIRSAGLSRIKASRIKESLRRIYEDRGEYSLGFLKDMPPENAMNYLTNFPGIGVKTAACVLLFSFGMPVFPVDTHIHRVSGRLELIPKGADRIRAQEIMQSLAPADAVYSLHLLIIELGRRICSPRKPRHKICPLRDICPSAKSDPG